VDIKKLVVDDNKIMCLPPIIKAAQKLEKLGCRAIVGECGYFAYFQREVAASVKVPVFMSSLLQVPLAQQVVGNNQVVGILMANSQYLTDHHLESVGIRLGSNYVIGGAMDDGRCEEFDHLWTSGLRSEPPGCGLRQSRIRVPGCGNRVLQTESQNGRDGAGMHRLPALRARPAA
jgi:hypothetical protein